MEQLGWDGSNTRAEGKNLYVFRDTTHIDLDIQEKILSELESMIKEGYFKYEKHTHLSR